MVTAPSSMAKKSKPKEPAAREPVTPLEKARWALEVGDARRARALAAEAARTGPEAERAEAQRLLLAAAARPGGDDHRRGGAAAHRLRGVGRDPADSLSGLSLDEAGLDVGRLVTPARVRQARRMRGRSSRPPTRSIRRSRGGCAECSSSARPLLDRGLGVCAYRYDASNPKRFRAAGWIELGIRSPRFRSRVLGALGHLDAAYVERSCRTVTCERVGATLDFVSGAAALGAPVPPLSCGTVTNGP